MSDYTFSEGISDEVRQNTEALFEWLVNRENHGKTLPATLRQAVEAGAVDVHATDEYHDTALHMAAYRANDDLLEQLLEHGASPNTINCDHKTPMHYAAELGDLAAIKCLDHYGADLNARDDRGFTMLHLTASKGAVDAIEWLIEKGAEIDARAIGDSTPLDFSLNGQKHAVNLLLDHGASILACYSFNPTELKEKCQATFDAWHDQTLSPADLTKTQVMQMLNVWPLTDPQAPVPRFEHLDAIFKDERWNEVDAQQKLDLIKEIPGISNREQMYLLGGQAMRVLMKEQAPTPQPSR